MELGAKTLIILLIGCLLMPLSIYGSTWRAGVLPLDDSALVDDEDILAAEQFASAVNQFFTTIEYRDLSQKDQRYISRREDREVIRQFQQEISEQVSGENEQFFTEGEVQRVSLKPPAFEREVPERLPFEKVFLDKEILFGEEIKAYLTALEHELDEIIGFSLVDEKEGYQLHVYQYHRGTNTMDTLHFSTYSGRNPVTQEVLSQVLDMYHRTEKTVHEHDMPETREFLFFRGIPSQIRVSGEGGMYQAAKEGYTSRYVRPEEKEGMIEVKLNPRWSDTIYSAERKADRFYRSLAGAMLTIPAAFLTYGMSSESIAAQMAHQGVLAVSFTMAARTVIDLFRYTLSDL